MMLAAFLIGCGVTGMTLCIFGAAAQAEREAQRLFFALGSKGLSAFEQGDSAQVTKGFSTEFNCVKCGKRVADFTSTCEACAERSLAE